jgi:L-ribulose-5-phosphate 3-epimerase
MTHLLGACSWSLQTKGPEELVEKLDAVGVDCVQLALDPLRTGAWPVEHAVHVLRSAGVQIVSGMMAMAGEDYSTLESIARTGGLRPNARWMENLEAARRIATLSQQLDIELVTLHAGHFGEDPDDDEMRTCILDRLRQVVDVFAEQRVRIALETGPDSAETLLECLEELDRPTVGLNFDPANMILYANRDPVATLRAVIDNVVQIHIKDARAATEPGTWGAEVRVGTGDVDWAALFTVVREAGFEGPLMIEREAGTDRVADMQAARAVVEQHVTVAKGDA